MSAVTLSETVGQAEAASTTSQTCIQLRKSSETLPHCNSLSPSETLSILHSHSRFCWHPADHISQSLTEKADNATSDHTAQHHSVWLNKCSNDAINSFQSERGKSRLSSTLCTHNTSGHTLPHPLRESQVRVAPRKGLYRPRLLGTLCIRTQSDHTLQHPLKVSA